jgi:ADP-ribosyl-[dinitrogen reductase] hydrolase
MKNLADRIAGSLYGLLLVGDALGCPVEGWSPSKITTTYGVLREMEEATENGRPRGLHSDDGARDRRAGR